MSEQLNLGDVYDQMERAEVGSGQVFKRVLISPTVDLVAFVNTQERTRGVRFEFKNQSQLVQSVDQVRGVRITLSSAGPDTQSLTIEQVRPGDSQLFVVFISDLARAIESPKGAESKAAAERIVRWRAFFRRNVEGLSKDEQLGLVAELIVLEKLALAGVGFEDAVKLWEGPHAEVHDFSALDWALEVKATSSLASSLATINSERQLDPSNVMRLFMIFLGIDVRPHGQGSTLPQTVLRLRKALAGYPSPADHFEDLLIDAGYLDLHSPLYSSFYEVKREEIFAVRDDFPSLRPDSIPAAVSHTRYALNVDLCQGWRVKFAQMIEALEL